MNSSFIFKIFDTDGRLCVKKKSSCIKGIHLYIYIYYDDMPTAHRHLFTTTRTGNW